MNQSTIIIAVVLAAILATSIVAMALPFESAEAIGETIGGDAIGGRGGDAESEGGDADIRQRGGDAETFLSLPSPSDSITSSATGGAGGDGEGGAGGDGEGGDATTTYNVNIDTS
jgi:hypothetical protein